VSTIYHFLFCAVHLCIIVMCLISIQYSIIRFISIIPNIWTIFNFFQWNSLWRIYSTLFKWYKSSENYSSRVFASKKEIVITFYRALSRWTRWSCIIWFRKVRLGINRMFLIYFCGPFSDLKLQPAIGIDLRLIWL
jgi:hypothetical protein